MKRILACLCFGATLVQLPAALDFHDSFNYTPDGVQLTNATATWVAYPPGGIAPTNFAGSLSYPGLQTAVGDNSVMFNGSGASGIAARNLSQLYNIGNTFTLYYSLTFQVVSIATADWGGSGNFLTGSFMMGFNQKLQSGTALAQADTAAPLLIRTGDPNNVSGTANDFQSYQLGTGLTATSAQRTFDASQNYVPGETLFLVLSYTFGPGAGDDVARLYVNPTPGSPENANTPVVTVSGGTEVTAGQIQSFYLRNNSVEPARTQIDDLRVGTAWEDVTPAVPEPAAAALMGLGMLVLGAARRRRRS